MEDVPALLVAALEATKAMLEDDGGMKGLGDDLPFAVGSVGLTAEDPESWVLDVGLVRTAPARRTGSTPARIVTRAEVTDALRALLREAGVLKPLNVPLTFHWTDPADVGGDLE